MKKIEITVGLFVAIGLAALFMLAMKVSSMSNFASANNYYLKANFDEIGGLKVRAPVTVAGVKVGQVHAIKLSNVDYSAEVTIAVNSELLPMQQHDGNLEAIFDPKTGLPKFCQSDKNCATPFFEDAAASIFTAGLLGEQYIGLGIGGGSQTLLENNGYITITQSAIGLEQIIGQLLVGGASGTQNDNDEDLK